MSDEKWYIVQVVPNHEQQVKELLERREFMDSESQIKEILHPIINHVTKTNKNKRRPMFPGYLFVKVQMSDDAWYVIRNTQYVTGIVGSSGQRTKPTPIPEEQILRIIEQVKKEEEQTANITKSESGSIITAVNYSIGDEILIKDGNFANQIGKVIDISIIKQVVTVEIDFFGRSTSIQLALNKIQKL